MADNSKRTGAAIEAHYQFVLWLSPTLEKFPRDSKFTLVSRPTHHGRSRQSRWKGAGMAKGQALSGFECQIGSTIARTSVGVITAIGRCPINGWADMASVAGH